MKLLCKNKYWKLNEEYDTNKVLYLLIDRPTFINFINNFIWLNKKDQHHRDYDLPSFICSNGYYVYWYINNNLHRENSKSAIIQFDDEKEYYINGQIIK